MACQASRKPAGHFSRMLFSKPHYSALVDALTVADDSGLSVNALNGRPGVHSARYGLDAAERNARLLLELSGVSDRAARFSCALAAAVNGKIIWTVEKHVHGRIAERATGRGGFGYDPVFVLLPLGTTMAELTIEEKNRVSARGQALAELKRFLAANETFSRARRLCL